MRDCKNGTDSSLRLASSAGILVRSVNEAYEFAYIICRSVEDFIQFTPDSSGALALQNGVC